MNITSSLILLVTLKTNIHKTRLSDLSIEEVIDNGTGFLIRNNGVFVTAKHVLNCEQNERVYAVINDQLVPIKTIRRFDLVGDGDYNDYELCKIPLSNSEYFKEIPSSKVKSGEKLRLLGFSRRVKSKFSSEITLQDGIIYYNEISGFLFNHGLPKIDGLGPFENGFIMLYNESIEEFPFGMSGGPIVNSVGRVVGLLSRAFNEEGALCLSIEKLLR